MNPPPSLIFVCTGNICRSPMAEYLLRARLGPLSDWHIASSGIFAVEGMPISAHARHVLGERNIDARAHRSRQLTRGATRAADVIIAMTQGHRDQIQAEMPECRGKLFLLRGFDPTAPQPDVDDPIGGSDSDYRTTARVIDDALAGLTAFLKTYRRTE